MCLVPDFLFPSYRAVTVEFLQRQGICLLLCDLDYTLAPRCVSTPDDALRQWLEALSSAGIKAVIVSNNRSCRRVETFCRDLPISWRGRAGKPRPGALRAAMAAAGISPEHTAMLGDKLLTDVLGAHLAGIRAVMVEPLGGPRGAWNCVLHLLQRPFKAACRRKMGK